MLVSEEESVRAIGFDPRGLTATSSPVPVLDQVFRIPGGGSAGLAVAATGTLVYVSGGFERSLVMVDRERHETPVRVPRRGYRFPHVSPDGRYVAVTVDPRPSSIWIVDLLRETAAPLTTDGWHSIDAAWAPDGTRLAFYRRGGIAWLRWPSADTAVAAAPDSHTQWGPSWTPNGKIVAFEEPRKPDTTSCCWTLPTVPSDPSSRPRRRSSNAAVSPDGRWVAFTSDVSGTNELYLAPFTRETGPVRVSKEEGADPIWSRDGRALYFRSGERIMRVRWTGIPPGGQQEEMIEGSYDFTQDRNWDVLPDGRFLMIRADPAARQRFRVVLGFSADLARNL